MKRKKFSIIILIILFLSIGFAVLASNLSVTNLITIKKPVFDIHYGTVEVYSTSLENPTYQVNESKNEISFTTQFTKPGDYVDYAIEVVNAGTIDGAYSNKSLTGLDSDAIVWSLKYLSDTDMSEGDIIRAGTVKKLKLHIEFPYQINEIVNPEPINATLSLSYIQAKTVDENTWNFDFTGTEQVLTVPKSGKYKLEVWGAEGGLSPNGSEPDGGYGGYSTGEVTLNANDKLYINVGGQGTAGNPSQAIYNFAGIGGYNGGGKGGTGVFHPTAHFFYVSGSGGGGATHIALSTGLLSAFENNKDDLLIVAGGGGGYGYGLEVVPGNGGGYKGTPDDNHLAKTNISKCFELYHESEAATQESGYKFGIGQNGRDAIVTWNCNAEGNGGAGGGFYGGKTNQDTGSCSYSAGSGGSGYIGNTKLTNKEMYCYKCEGSTVASTKTTSTNNTSEVATPKYAKKRNGYARITFLR